MSADEVWLVRHGETEWSRDHKHTSTTELPLTDVGEEVARALAAKLAGRRLRPRAHQPAAARPAYRRAGRASRDAEVDEDLVEWAYGDYEGITTVEIRETVPGLDRLDAPDARRRDAADEIATRLDRVVARAPRRRRTRAGLRPRARAAGLRGPLDRAAPERGPASSGSTPRRCRCSASSGTPPACCAGTPDPTYGTLIPVPAAGVDSSGSSRRPAVGGLPPLHHARARGRPGLALPRARRRPAAVAARRGVVRRVRRAPHDGGDLPDLPAVADEPRLARDRTSGWSGRRGRAVATVTCCSGTSELDGAVDVPGRLGGGRDGPRRPLRGHAAGATRAPRSVRARRPRTCGSTVTRPRCGRSRPASADADFDRAVLVGEAQGRWLWIVLRPASALLLLRDDWILRDVASVGPAVVEMPFGGPPPAW